MPLRRVNVWELGKLWAEPILWYARALAELKRRPLAERTSWRFYAAIHGFDGNIWKFLGFLQDSEQMPNQAEIQQVWNQCQHASWYFLPWHRGYLLNFEAIVRAEIVRQGGPESWALPYWNYFKPGQCMLPPAFASADWPCGKGDNPLYEPRRYGPEGNGNVVVTLSSADLNAMSELQFIGVADGGSRGFGGPKTGFSHRGPIRNPGALESRPHNTVHSQVGGRDPNTNILGLMASPATAALDPIFWLHHANIDRLWEAWVRLPGRTNPDREPDWMQLPAGHRFSVPKPDGCLWNFVPAELLDLNSLGYTYDDLSPGMAPRTLADRLRRRGGRPKEETPAETPRDVELLGANRTELKIYGAEARTCVAMDRKTLRKLIDSLGKMPDRAFLNLENVSAHDDSIAFRVYVGGAAGKEHEPYFERLAGTIGLFGITENHARHGEHEAQVGIGTNYTLEITDIVDELYTNNALDRQSLEIRIAPLKPIPADAQLRIARVSIYRQGT
jgi:tyrosinase